MIKVTKFGKTAQFFIENLNNEKALNSYCNLENVSSQLRTTCFRFATLFNDGYIQKDIKGVLSITKEEADEELLKAEEKRINHQRRVTMAEAQTPTYNLNRTKDDKIILKGTKVTGAKGEIKANKIAVDEFKSHMKRNGLEVKTVYNQDNPNQVDHYEVADPTKKIKEKPLYYHLQTLIDMGDKFYDVRSKKYDIRAKGDTQGEAKLQTEENRLKMAWQNSISITALEDWVVNAKTMTKPEREEFFNGMLDDLKDLEAIGFVQYSDKKVKDRKGNESVVEMLTMTDNDHRIALFENSDKDLKDLEKIHNEILVKQAEKKAEREAQKAPQTPQAEAETPKHEEAPQNEASSEKPIRANWNSRPRNR